MKTNVVLLKKYEADEGKVFDWKEPHFELNEVDEEVQIHLYARQLFMGENDSIDNYVEVEESKEE